MATLTLTSTTDPIVWPVDMPDGSPEVVAVLTAKSEAATNGGATPGDSAAGGACAQKAFSVDPLKTYRLAVDGVVNGNDYTGYIWLLEDATDLAAAENGGIQGAGLGGDAGSGIGDITTSGGNRGASSLLASGGGGQAGSPAGNGQNGTAAVGATPGVGGSTGTGAAGRNGVTGSNPGLAGNSPGGGPSGGGIGQPGGARSGAAAVLTYTAATAPTVGSPSVRDVGPAGCFVSSTITNNGKTPTSRFLVSLTNSIGAAFLSIEAVNGIGEAGAEIAGLFPNTTYFIWCQSTNSIGSTDSASATFTTAIAKRREPVI